MLQVYVELFINEFSLSVSHDVLWFLQRNYYVVLLKKWINDALETCESIDGKFCTFGFHSNIKHSYSWFVMQFFSTDHLSNLFNFNFYDFLFWTQGLHEGVLVSWGKGRTNLMVLSVNDQGFNTKYNNAILRPNNNVLLCYYM